MPNEKVWPIQNETIFKLHGGFNTLDQAVWCQLVKIEKYNSHARGKKDNMTVAHKPAVEAVAVAVVKG